jgi:hypothetical protein
MTASGDVPNLVSNLLLLCYCVSIQGVLKAKHLPSARQIHMGCPSSRHGDKEASISLDALENTRQSCSDALKHVNNVPQHLVRECYNAAAAATHVRDCFHTRIIS